MGHKSLKQGRKTILFYRVHYNLIPPYHVICDGTILHHGIEKKMFLKEVMPKLLGASKVTLVTTKCVCNELKDLVSMGEVYKQTLGMAKRMEKSDCHHELVKNPSLVNSAFATNKEERSEAKPANDANKEGKSASLLTYVPAEECIMALVRYYKLQNKAIIVASHDKSLLYKLSLFANCVAIYCINGTLQIAKPSKVGKRVTQNLDRKKLEHRILEDKQAVEKAIEPKVEDIPVSHGNTGIAEEEKPKRKKRKGPKGPNPLSCKKRIKKDKQSQSVFGENGSAKSTRKRRKKTRAHDNGDKPQA